MGLPYENTSSGARAIEEIQRILSKFGCQQFGQFSDYEKKSITVQFKYRGNPVSVEASISGYAAAWLREHPYKSRMRCSQRQHEQKALDVAGTAVFSILRDWIKGQVMAVESGILSFEGAFLGQIMLANGKTVHQQVVASKMLPALEGDAA